MATNIMNKIAAVLRTDSCDEVDKSDDGVKYGDDDVSSKRRKDATDEYEQEFASHFVVGGAASARLNSTAAFGEDFTGGLVSDEDASSLSTVVPFAMAADDGRSFEEEFNCSISVHPSDSSCGFHNTFSVLERQLHVKKQPKLSQQQIEYILLKNNDVAVKNPIYIDIPISDEWGLRAVGGHSSAQDEPPASLFDLKIEAMLRVKELLGSGRKADASAHGDAAAAHIPINTSLLEDFYQQDGGECPDYVYHVAKSKDGRTYLRVVRSFLVDKGKLRRNHLLVCLFLPRSVAREARNWNCTPFLSLFTL